MATEFAELARELLEGAGLARHRAVLVLAGGRAWATASAQQVLEICMLDDAVWITDAKLSEARLLHGAHARQMLGVEVDAVVFDIYAGLDVEAVGAVTGAIRAGGLLVLLAPRKADWPQFVDPEQARVTVYPVPPEQVPRRYLQRFLRELGALGVVWLEEGAPAPPLPSFAGPTAPLRADEEGCLTADQRAAHDAIVALVAKGSREVLVLNSDRGRGKSAALGLAAATLLRSKISRIVVTGPRFDAAAQVFAHAQKNLPAAKRTRDLVRFRDARLQFVPPEEISTLDTAPELLLVDEAAAIPVPLLEKMIALPVPIVFATTVHGYEGSGRGFATRFQTTLTARRSWRGMRLDQPVRWADGDPLELFAFRALLLNGAPAADGSARQSLSEGCRFEPIDRDSLLENDALLGQIFGLLVLAHYRTSPLDLRFLLDGPNLTLWLARCGKEVVGAALVAAEGGFDPAMARAVWEGSRRPRGHLLPQSLAVHAGFEEAPTLLFQRIVRLAVHPAVQGRGIGGALVEAICSAAQGAADAMGSSFGASPQLAQFWREHRFEEVRLGVTREAASGAPALMVLRPLTDAGRALAQEAHARYCESLPYLLADPLRDLEPGLAAVLKQSVTEKSSRSLLDARDWGELSAYAAGRRELELVLAPLDRLLDAGALARLAPESRAMVEAKLRDHKSWRELIHQFRFRGKNEAATGLRRALAQIIEERGGAPIKGAIASIGREDRSTLANCGFERPPP